MRLDIGKERVNINDNKYVALANTYIAKCEKQLEEAEMMLDAIEGWYQTKDRPSVELEE